MGNGASGESSGNDGVSHRSPLSTAQRSQRNGYMKRTTPGETKLTICVWHTFAFWRPQPIMAETIRKRWPEMNVMHLPNYDVLPPELPDTDIFVGYSLRADQLQHAKKLKWLHWTGAGGAQMTNPVLRDSRVLGTKPRGVFAIRLAEPALGVA